MGRYNANERKPLTKSFLEGQKKQTKLAEFKPDTVESFWKEMSEKFSPKQIEAMRGVKNPLDFERYKATWLR